MKSVFLLFIFLLVSCGGASDESDEKNTLRKKHFVESMTADDGLYFAITSLPKDVSRKYIVLKCKKIKSVSNQRKINHIVDLIDYLEDNSELIRIGNLTLDHYHERKMLFKARRLLLKEVEKDIDSIECPREILAQSIDFKKPQSKK